MADEKDIWVDGEGKFSISDIQHGNAGNSFIKNGKWVRAWENIDGDNYSEVRDDDKIESVLTSEKHLQFTRNILEKYIRLIMPKYTRRVEIEDLNRNFWVIGQALSAIGAYLFEKQRIEDIHFEILYLPNDKYRPYVKYDDFNKLNVPNNNYIIECLQNYKLSYPKSNLCLIPVIRQENYYKNYYKKETYPGVYFYNRMTDQEKFINFTNGTIDATDEQWTQRSGAIRWDEEEFKYHYGYPMSQIGEIKDLEEHRYYNCLRVKPHNGMSVSINNQNELQLSNFQLDIYDAAYQAWYGTAKEIGTLKYSDPITENSSNIALNIETENSSQKINTIKSKTITRGFYLGELVSSTGLSQGLTYDITVKEITLPPLKKDDSRDVTAYRDTDARILKAYAQEYGETEIDKSVFTLYIGIRHYDFYRQSGAEADKKYSETYFYLDNNNNIQSTTEYIKDDNDETIYATTHSGTLSTSAVLFDATNTDNVLNFPLYNFPGERGWATGYTEIGKGTHGWSDTHSYIYIPKSATKITKDNWCIRFVQANGVYTFADSQNGEHNISNKDLIHNALYSTSGTYDKESEEGTFEGIPRGMCNVIKISLFYPDEKFVSRTYYRAWDNASYSNPERILITNKNSDKDKIEQWYIADGTSNGVPNREVPCNNLSYNYYREKLDSDWQLNKGDTKIDFEKYPVTGDGIVYTGD